MKYFAIVLGGGLSGLATAYSLSSDDRPVLVLESSEQFGGLAGSFESDGLSYPLGYPHILSRDLVLLSFLDRLGVLRRVRWRRVRMLFETCNGWLDLSAPRDFLRFPLPLGEKLRFCRLMFRSINYTALMSVVCAAQAVELPDFYWLNLSRCQSAACAIFRLDALNPTLARPGEMVLNFVTHLANRSRPFFHAADREIVGAYLSDYKRLFGAELRPRWLHLSRVPAYSPVFDRAFRNPPVHSATWPNVYFAGNYRTFPSVASTGTALRSGLEAASAILRDRARSRPTVHAAPAA